VTSSRIEWHWPVIALRGAAALLLALAIFLLPFEALPPLALLFASYIAADGALAIIAAIKAGQRGGRAGSLYLEGAFNLAAAAAVLAWPAIAIIPFVRLASSWAVITGALLLAAAHRLAGRSGRRFLALCGAASAAWGIAMALAGPSVTGKSQALGAWLIAYGLIFGGALLALAGRLRHSARRAG
jgi:uncharacterized membrane protein HdeD (DUF308 family)